jgi:hypothetical protein
VARKSVPLLGGAVAGWPLAARARYGLVHMSGTRTGDEETDVCQTLCLRRIGGAWKITEHTSVPFYMDQQQGGPRPQA